MPKGLAIELILSPNYILILPIIRGQRGITRSIGALSPSRYRVITTLMKRVAFEYPSDREPPAL